MRRIDLDVRVAKLRAAREGDAVFHFGARMLDVDIDCERRADAEALALAAARSRHRDGDAVGRIGCFQVDVAAAERDRGGSRLVPAHDCLMRDDADADRDRAGDAGVAAARAGARLGAEDARRLDERVRFPGTARSETDGMTGKRVRARGGELGGVVVIADDVISLVVGKPADVIGSASGALVGHRIAGVQHAALAEINEPVVARRVEHDRIGGE